MSTNVFAPAHAGKDWQFVVLLEVRVLHRKTSARACGPVSRYRAKPRRGAQKARGGQEPEGRRLAIRANLAGGVSARGVRGCGPGGDEGWVGLGTLYTSWSVALSALTNPQSGPTPTSHSSTRDLRNFC